MIAVEVADNGKGIPQEYQQTIFDKFFTVESTNRKHNASVDDEVIEKILRHLKLWPEQTAPACLSRAPPPDGGERIFEPFLEDPFPDYDTEPVYLSSEALA